MKLSARRPRFRRVPSLVLLRRLTVLTAILAAPSVAIANWSSDPRVNLPVCTHSGDQGMPALLADGYGGAYVAWYDTRPAPNHADIYATHILAQGIVDPSWPADGLAVCTAWSAQMEPRIIPDGGTGMLIGWWDQRVAANNPDLYFQHVLANGTVDPAWPVNGAPVMITLDNQYIPFMMSDGAGGAFFCFGDNDGTSNNVYAQHMLASGARDPLWSDAGLKLCWVAGSQLYPDAISDGSGGMLVTWGDDRATVGGVYATRVLGTGSIHPSWPTNGFAVCTSTIDISSVKLVSDGSGGAIVTWSDKRGGQTGDIYAQHLLLNGTTDPGWPSGGLPVCTAAGLQVVPAIVSDGAHGAIVSWWDQRSGNFDLYSHHVLLSGVVDPAWPADGRALVAMPGDQTWSRTAVKPDGRGGAFCAWSDARSGTASRDIYAGRILPTGPDPGWPANGLAVCTADSIQNSPSWCVDGSGGMIVAWADKRSGEFDLYAQRVAADAALPNVGAGGAAPPALEFASPRPNPATDHTRLRVTSPASGHVRVDVFDAGGRLVRVLADEELAAGTREFAWDLRDADGRRACPGLYLARALAGGRLQTRRIVVLDRSH